MKQVNEMTYEELTNYFINKKLSGLSYRELLNIFEKNNIDDETRKSIISKLNEIDEKQKEESRKVEKANKKGSGIISILIGLGILIFGFILYFASVKSGVVFIFNFVVWAFGGLLVLRGLVSFISGFVKND